MLNNRKMQPNDVLLINCYYIATKNRNSAKRVQLKILLFLREFYYTEK